MTTDNAVLRIDPRTGRITRRIPVPADSLAAWLRRGRARVTDPVDGVVWRIQLGPPRLVMRTIEAGIGAAAVAAGARAVWVVNGADTTVVRIDPVSGRASRRACRDLARGRRCRERRVGVARGCVCRGRRASGRQGGGRGSLVQRHRPGGSGRQRDVLIVWDLPFQGRSRAQALRSMRRSPRAPRATTA